MLLWEALIHPRDTSYANVCDVNLEEYVVVAFWDVCEGGEVRSALCIVCLR